MSREYLGTTYYVDVRVCGEVNPRASIPFDTAEQADEVKNVLDNVDWVKPAVIAWDKYQGDPLPRLTRDELTQIIAAAARDEYVFAPDQKEIS